MTQVTKRGTRIDVLGHAGDKIVCAMITSQSVGLIKNITERLHEEPEFILSAGVFVINTKGLSEKARDLVDAYLYVLKGLSHDYPNNIKYHIN